MKSLETASISPADRQLMSEVIIHLPLGVLVYRIDDPDDLGSIRILHLNEISAEFFRVPLDEIIGRRAREFAPEMVDSPMSKALASVAVDGEPADLGEIFYESPRLRPGYYRIRAFPIGEMAAAAVFEDVSPQREMRDSLERQALRFRAIFNATFQFIGLLRPDGTLLEVNQTALDFGGLQEEDVVGKPYWDCYWWQHSPTVQRQLKASIRRAAAGEFVRYNVQIQGKDGSRAVIDFSVKPVYDRGEVILLIPEGREITDLVKAQRTLKRLQKRMERILNAAGEGIVSVEPGGTVTFVNEAAATLLGPSPDDLVGRHHSEVLRHVDGGEHEPLASPVDRVLRLERTERAGTAKLGRDDGGSFPVDFIVTPLREGSRTGAVVVFRDVSDRIEAERTLRESEERYRTILTTLDEGVMLIDATGEIIMVNPAAQEFFGFDEANPPNVFDADREIYREDGSHFAVEELAEYRALQSGEPQRGVIKGLPRPDGEIRWYSVNAQPVKNRHGKPEAAVVSFDDITERLEAERELRRSESQLQNAQQLAHLGGWHWDVESDQITWSEELYRIYGLDSHTFEPTLANFLEHIHPDDRDRMQRTVEKAMQALEAYEIVHRIVRPSGEIRVLLGRGEVVTNDDGQVVALQGTGQDVTEQQQARDALQRYARQLEERNVELEQFAYVASHDLQEPLRMISSFLQLLERRYGDSLDDTAEEYIRFAVQGAKRMQRLIHDLLAYSRVGTRGKAFQRVDLDELVRDVLDDLGAAAAESGATVQFKDLPVVQADPTQMRQLFQNLIGNAFKFRSDRSPSVEIRAEREIDDERPIWRIAVQDNGIGISSEHRERIFQIFQRLHTREEYEGTGIGLAICRKIVERHGGRIWVDSAPDGGAIFSFTLPVRPPRNGDASTPT